MIAIINRCLIDSIENQPVGGSLSGDGCKCFLHTFDRVHSLISDLLGLEWSGFGIKSTPVQITLGLASS